MPIRLEARGGLSVAGHLRLERQGEVDQVEVKAGAKVPRWKRARTSWGSGRMRVVREALTSGILREWLYPKGTTVHTAGCGPDRGVQSGLILLDSCCLL